MVGSATEVEEVATEVGGAGRELVGLGAHATGAAASAAHAIRAPVILFIPTGRYRASSRPATAPQPDLGQPPSTWQPFARARSRAISVAMDFSPTAREIEFLGTAKRLMEGRVYPLEAKLLETKSFRAVLPELERARDEVRAAGLFAPQLGRTTAAQGCR